MSTDIKLRLSAWGTFGVVISVVFATLLLTCRFVSGRPLIGRRQTNATFLHRGTEQFNPRDRVYPWTFLPEWQKAAWRVGGTFGTVTLVWGEIRYPTATRVALVLLVLALASWAGWILYRDLRRWRHRRDWVLPLHRVLAPIVGVPRTARPESWLNVPVGFRTSEGRPVVIHVPPDCPLIDRKTFISVVADRLQLDGFEPRWNLSGYDPTVTFLMIPRPPRRVDLEMARPFIDNAPDFAPVIGLGRRNAVVAADLEGDSPHVLISAGSGAGKSVLARNLAAQMLGKGGAVIILDRKLISHRWANTVPGVTYCRTIAQVHDTLVALAAEVDRRNEAVGSIPDEYDLDQVDLSFVGPRIGLIYEEMNATAQQLKSYWESIREKGDPKKSPAIAAFQHISFTGRAVRVHMVAIGQMMTALATGGPEARENFGIRILARYTANNWKMLVPEVPYVRTPRKPRGRCQVVMGGEAHETQPVFLTDKEARSLALEWTERGNPVPQPFGTSRPFVPTSARQDTISDLGDNAGTADRGVTLREAVAAGLVGLTLDQLQADRKRKRDRFPRPIDPTAPEFRYYPSELKRWEAQREGIDA